MVGIPRNNLVHSDMMCTEVHGRESLNATHRSGDSTKKNERWECNTEIWRQMKTSFKEWFQRVINRAVADKDKYQGCHQHSFLQPKMQGRYRGKKGYGYSYTLYIYIHYTIGYGYSYRYGYRYNCIISSDISDIYTYTYTVISGLIITTSLRPHYDHGEDLGNHP